MNSALRNALAGLAIAAACIPAAQAQVNSKNQGYLVTGPNFDVVTAVGGTVCVRAPVAGVCVRTSDWTPARAAAAAACKQCTPDLCPVPPPPPKPVPPKPEAKPEAKPAAKPAPEKLLPQKINFSADALFDFDKADLRSEGKAMLEELTRVLQGATYEVILAIGHADRIGSTKYNQKLSVRQRTH